MTTDTSRVAERMFDVLVDVIRSERPELLDEGFTVAEIYQNLVPYRSHRDRIGVEMNGDYEHALLRLLAGEGERLEVGSEAARRRFREELESVRPDTGVYRNFAAVEVRLNEERIPVPAGEAQGRSARTEPGGVAGEGGSSPDGTGTTEGAAPSQDEPRDGDSSADRPPESTTGGPAAGAPAPGDATTGEERDGAPDPPSGSGPAASPDDDAGRETCSWCRERLPDRADLRYCPYCGSRADLMPCPECGAELEAEWLFCPACGTGVRD